jgi:hypothetical protein
MEEETVTDPGQPRPVPGPPRAAPVAVSPRTQDTESTETAAAPEGSLFAGLAERPVSEHVAVYEAEHQRLQRELSTIDQL